MLSSNPNLKTSKVYVLSKGISPESGLSGKRRELIVYLGILLLRIMYYIHLAA